MINKKGFSLIELLIAISIFAVIGVLSTSAMSLTLRTSKKSDSMVRVRENVNYSLAIMERLIRNASNIVNCDGSTTSSLSYMTADGDLGLLSCVTPGETGYIASGSGSIRITSSDISVTDCAFTCTQDDVNSPPIVKLSITASDNLSTSTEKGSISSEIEIVTRNY